MLIPKISLGTPLHWAAQHGHKDTAVLLVKLGADINAKNKSGHTPMDKANQLGRQAMVEMLKKAAEKS